jgi:pimeloyl-ACP methyl ester carboxylesterase
LIDAFPTHAWTSDTPWAPTPEQWRDAAVGIRDHWGTRAWLERTLAGQVDKEELDWFARYMRSSITPAALAAEMERYVGADIRSVLPAIHVPTLVFVDPEV